MKATLIALLAVVAIAAADAAEFHVAASGSDSNPGSGPAPLRTIQRAADLAQPGDVVTVHQGVYRERVNPPRGGASDRNRIVYQAAPGEKVEIKGSEIVKKWQKVKGDVWKVTLSNAFFGKFNPYSDLIHGDWFNPFRREHHTGAVYLNGEWLVEAARLEEVLAPPGSLPPKTTQKNQPVLLNIAWLQPDGKSTVRTAATGFVAKEGTRNAPCAEGGACVGWIRQGDWLRYVAVNFGTRSESLEIRAASATTGGKIFIHLGTPDGELLGTCSVPDTGGWQSWVSFKARIKPLSGSQSVCLVFGGKHATGSPAGLWFGQADKENTTIWAQFKGVNPNEQLVEINVRRTVFYPHKPGRNYITVRGFAMRHAATPWAPPTAEQIGLIGTHWSKGWIIENNTISHSKCSGISLGKYGDEWDNKSQSAEGYVETIHRALSNGWSKQNIGGHLVRNNRISNCEQTGIVGSLGAAFSTITGNTIHDIYVQRVFSGAEIAGIKFHAAIDVQVSHNHIYRAWQGLWLDWMAQGTRVTGNLFHDNQSQDMFFEVDHGPILVDNNLFFSERTLLDKTQGLAFVHNLVGGAIKPILYDSRQTPFHKPHSTEVVALHDNPCGDARYYNNLFVVPADLSPYDEAKLPVWMDGNVYSNHATPSKHEAGSLVQPEFSPSTELVEEAGSFYIDWKFDKSWIADHPCKMVTTELLGKASVPGVPFENPDGTPYRINTDYFGKKRDESNPTPGPFENPGTGELKLKVW